MKTVGIETSGKIGSVAICDGDEVVAERSFEKGMLHGKELVPAIKLIFDENSLKPADIDLIAVDVGPGSFTGVRVGITCAKTLSYVLNRPVIDVVSLDAIVQNVELDAGIENVCVVLDARRNRVYSCFYGVTLSGNVGHDVNCRNKWARRSELLLVSVDEIIDRLTDGALVLGDGASSYLDFFEKKNVLIDKDSLDIARASNVAFLGKRAYLEGRRCDLKSISPVYMQRPEALEHLEKKRGLVQ